ncbi:MAG: Ada metal-binding domain-containing protein [Patescibacteria group bacterium]
MLKNLASNVKNWFLPRENELFLAAVIILLALASFGLGRLSALKSEKFPIQFIEPQNQEAAVASVLGNLTPKSEAAGEAGKGHLGEKLYVASKNSSVYHFPWCSGAQRIKETNKIYFSSREEAEKAGYRPAANCEGL